MPKHRLPLQSGNVAGKMDENRIFATLRGQTYSKRYVIPKQPNTKAQKETYARMAWAMRLWQRWLTEEDREAWRAFAQRERKVDRFTMSPTRPPAHSVFIRFAIQCRRAGFPPPHLPPRTLSPQPVRLDLVPKGKGVLIRWDPEESGVVAPKAKKGEPEASLKLELCLAVTPAWSRAWESLFTTLAVVPLLKGEHLYSPVRPGKRYTFSSRVITPDGQVSRPSLNYIAA